MAGVRLVALALCAFAALVQAKEGIFWEGCNAIADKHAETSLGFFYNLCVLGVKFKRRRHAWQFIKTDVTDVEFEACTFVNIDTHRVNFTQAKFTSVVFKNSLFGSFVTEPTDMLIEKTVMTSVLFENCRFDKSANLLFKSFAMNNVTFKDCIFESDTKFQLGSMNNVRIIGSKFARSENAQVSNEKNALRFESMTLNKLTLKDDIFQRPTIFSHVNAGDLTFNDTVFDEFWCHNRPGEAPKGFNGLATSSFNDTVFQRAIFNDKVECQQTTWRRMSMFNATFRADASFNKNNFEDIFWDKVDVPQLTKGPNQGCTTLDMSEGKIFRELIANLTVGCQLDLTKTSVEKTWFKNVKARDFVFKETTFHQGFIDGKCCTGVCPAYDCRCNYTRSPVDQCPKVRYPIDLNADQACFPASASLHTLDGTVRMPTVRHGMQAAIGASQHSDVYLFGHREPAAVARFVEITHTGPSEKLRISPRHYLYVNDRLATAASVRIGDKLQDASGYQLLVTDIGHVMDEGLYAPTSLHGDLIVDGVHVSSYTAALHPTLAHRLLSPLRWAHQAGLHRVVKRFTLLHERSYEPVARFLRFPQGPQVV